jgi:hypothetical protein
MTGLRKIRLELARGPGFPEGSSERGYEFLAPLKADGHIDADAWRAGPKDCTVRRFWQGEDDSHGHLRHVGTGWLFHYDLDREPAPDEPGFRFASHAFRKGEYVSITERDGALHTFKVAAVTGA